MLAQFHQHPVWLGLRGGFALAFVEAQGFTPRGADASTPDPAIIPEFRFGADVELPFYGGFAFALAIDWKRGSSARASRSTTGWSPTSAGCVR